MLLARASLLRNLLLFLFLTPLPSLPCLLLILVFFIFATLVSFCSLPSLAITTTDAFYTEYHCRGATGLHSWGFGAGDIPGVLGASWGAHSIPTNHRPRSADSAACASNCHDTFKLQLRRLPLSPPTFHPSLSPVPLTIFSSQRAGAVILLFSSHIPYVHCPSPPCVAFHPPPSSTPGLPSACPRATARALTDRTTTANLLTLLA